MIFNVSCRSVFNWLAVAVVGAGCGGVVLVDGALRVASELLTGAGAGAAGGAGV